MFDRCSNQIAEIAAICVTLFFRLIFYNNVELGCLRPDSPGYMYYDFQTIGGGLRTPGYPAVISIVRAVVGEKYYLTGTVFIQMALSALAVFLLYKIVRIATENKNLACLVAALWGCCPGIISWDVVILTESLSISISMVFLYFAVCYLKKNDKRSGFFMIVTAYFATWIRPAMVVYTISVLILLLMRLFLENKKRKETLFLLGILGGYFKLYTILISSVFTIRSI